MESVKVAVRCRPMSEKEMAANGECAVTIDGNTLVLAGNAGSDLGNNGNVSASARKARNGDQQRVYKFNNCYDAKSNQRDVFKDIGRDTVRSALGGYNATVCAYGQTGSGKTHTMLGMQHPDGSFEAGLIPRICRSLLHKIALTQHERARTSLQGTEQIDLDSESDYGSESDWDSQDSYDYDEDDEDKEDEDDVDRMLSSVGGDEDCTSNNNNNNNSNNNNNTEISSAHPETKEEHMSSTSTAAGAQRAVHRASRGGRRRSSRRMSTKASRRSSLDNNAGTAILYKLEAANLEIYNENIVDLLSDNSKSSVKKKLEVRDDGKGGSYVPGLTMRTISTMSDIDQIIAEGSKARSVKSTNSNAQSSRSHAVFTLVFTQTKIASDLKEAENTVSRINLVDLAGSERVKESGVAGEELREAKNINQSLFTLSRVVNALSELSKKNNSNNSSGGNNNNNNLASVPFRESQLTYLLKPCLGGNSRLTMLVTVSPANAHYSLTLGTLRYADKCADIKTTAIVNRDQNQVVLFELNEEIRTLRQQLAMRMQGNVSSEATGCKSVYELEDELIKQMQSIDQHTLRHKDVMESKDQRHQAQVELLKSQLHAERTAELQQHQETARALVQENEELRTRLAQLEVEKKVAEAVGGGTAGNDSIEKREQELKIKIAELASRQAKHEITCQTQRQNVDKLESDAKLQIVADRKRFEKEREISKQRMEGQVQQIEQRENAIEAERKALHDEKELILTQNQHAKEQATHQLTKLEAQRSELQVEIDGLVVEKQTVAQAWNDVDDQVKELEHVRAMATESVQLKEQVEELEKAALARIEAHESAMNTLRKSLQDVKNENAAALQVLKDGNTEEKRALMSVHTVEIEEIKAQHAKRMQENIERTSQDIITQAEESAVKMQELKEEHDDAMKDVQNQLETASERGVAAQKDRTKNMAKMHYEEMTKVTEEYEEKIRDLEKQVVDAEKSQACSAEVEQEQESKLQAMRVKYEDEVVLAAEASAAKLESLRTELEGLMTVRITDETEKHTQELEGVVKGHAEQLEELNAKWDVEAEETKQRHEILIREIRADHDEALTTARLAHEQSVEDMNEERRVAVLEARGQQDQAIGSVREELEAQLEAVEVAHATALSEAHTAKEKELGVLVAKHESELREVEQAAAEGLTVLTREHEIMTQGLLQVQEVEMAALTKTHDEVVEALKMSLETAQQEKMNQVSVLEADHNETIEGMSELYAAEKNKLSAKVEELELAMKTCEEEHKIALQTLREQLTGALSEDAVAHAKALEEAATLHEQAVTELKAAHQDEYATYAEKLKVLSDERAEAMTELEEESSAHLTTQQVLQKTTERAQSNAIKHGAELDNLTHENDALVEELEVMKKEKTELVNQRSQESVSMSLAQKEHNEEMKRQHEEDMSKKARELQTIQLKHQFEFTQLNEKHSEEVDRIREEMAKHALRHDEDLEALRIEHSSEMDAYVADWQARLESAEEKALEKEERLKDRIAGLGEAGEDMMQKHEQIVADMRTAHADAVEKVWIEAAEGKTVLEREHAEAIDALSVQLDGLMEAAQLEKQEHEEQIEQLESRHVEEFDALEEQKIVDMKELEGRYEAQLDHVEAQLHGEIEQLKDQLDHKSMNYDVQADQLKSMSETARSEIERMEQQLEEMKQQADETTKDFLAELEEQGTRYKDEMQQYLERDAEEWVEKVNVLKHEKRNFQKKLNESEEEKMRLGQCVERMSQDAKKSELQIQEVHHMMSTNEHKQRVEEIKNFKEWMAAGVSIIEHPVSKSKKPRQGICWLSATGRNGGLSLHVAKEVTGTWTVPPGKDGANSIDLADVLDVVSGCQTENFQRTGKIARMQGMSLPSDICFSLVTSSCTVDIECRTTPQHTMLFSAFKHIVATERAQRQQRFKVSGGGDDNASVMSGVVSHHHQPYHPTFDNEYDFDDASTQGGRSTMDRAAAANITNNFDAQGRPWPATKKASQAGSFRGRWFGGGTSK